MSYLAHPPKEPAKVQDVASPNGRGTPSSLVLHLVSEHDPLGSPHTASIHILDDDSFLYLCYLYRLAIFDDSEDQRDHLVGGRGWVRERWWYMLAQVCRRWRKLILGSASYLGLCLVCTYGTPVADMLAHSPPLPLVIDYFEEHRDIAAEDEEGVILALEQRDRVRRVRLEMHIPQLQKLVMAIDAEYPVLECLIVPPSMEVQSAALILSETLQAPRLRHLVLRGFALPVGSRLLTTAVGIVTLCLSMGHPAAYFPPDTLLRWISFMPQLETLLIHSLTNRDLERQLMDAPPAAHVTLSNLRFLTFHGGIAYTEVVLCQIATPRLQKLVIQLPWQFTFSIPRLPQFMNSTENLRFDRAKFEFSSEGIGVEFYPHEEAKTNILSIYVYCWHLDWQVSSVARIFNSLSQIPSTVEHLTLKQEVYSCSSEEHNEVDHTEWHKLLRSFSNVKTLHVDDGLVKELSRSLRLDDGELPLELLPELQELTYSGSGDGEDFASFIEARQNAGRPVTLMRHR